ncbi:uncharacterized protein [Eurosta solidaginis]|uniref:uncharacterized protein n=1 Tax=Eurosta solidaginis TaxID=178769 RepID=UPI0035310C25
MSEELIPSTPSDISLFSEQTPLEDESTTSKKDNEAVIILDTDLQLYDLLCSWGLSADSLIQLDQCGVKSMDILKMIHSHDIDEILNTRELIADKIKFRYQLQNWRLQNNASKYRLSTGTQPISLGHQPNLENILKDTVDGIDIVKKYENLNCLQETGPSTIVQML